MKNPRDIIIRPIITEKTMRLQSDRNCVTFEVKKGSNKTEIKQAIEAIFDVKVKAVNIVNVAGKKKRVGRYDGLTAAVRKAYVTLAEGSKIEVI